MYHQLIFVVSVSFVVNAIVVVPIVSSVKLVADFASLRCCLDSLSIGAGTSSF